MCEVAGSFEWGDIAETNTRIHDLLPGIKTILAPDYLRSFDAALGLLPCGADWRRLTPKSISVYTASPYNAAAQVRHDGYGPTPAAQLCAAIFKMQLASAKKASAIEARRAATPQSDAVHESAVAKPDAQTTHPIDPGCKEGGNS